MVTLHVNRAQDALAGANLFSREGTMNLLSTAFIAGLASCLLLSAGPARGAELSSKEKKTFARKAVMFWFLQHAGAPKSRVAKLMSELAAYEKKNWKGLPAVMARTGAAPSRVKKRRSGVVLSKPPAGLLDCKFIVAAPPGYSSRRTWPLVITLHGGGRGVGSGGQIMGLLGGTYLSRGCIVAAPTVPPNATFSEPVSETFIREIIWQVSLEYSVDPTRIYCTGHSMGGVGAWYMAVRMPDMFAACSPAAGNPSCVVDYRSLYNTPLFVVHGSTDTQVSPKDDQKAAAAIKALPAKDRREGYFVYREITTTDARGHALPAAIIKEMATWMLRWRQDGLPKRVLCVCPFIRTTAQPVIPYSRSFWLAIDGMNFEARADGTVEKDNVIRITATGANRIEVFLNDDMVDLDRPVKIYLNARLAHDKIVARSAAFLLEHARKTRNRGAVFAAKVVLSGN